MKRSRQESQALDAVSALVAAPGLRTWLAIVGAALVGLFATDALVLEDADADILRPRGPVGGERAG